ncbi:MAG: DUF5011 domain-containing protein [Candidatus Yanofskybacteria bacterium]|nr:DUF5011 domain-containing protein [Candidatus Yanofskybacteria bacterium]
MKKIIGSHRLGSLYGPTIFSVLTIAALVSGFFAVNMAKADPGIGDVIINEFVSHPDSGDKEWVELLNTTESSIDLSVTPLVLRDFTGGGAPNDTTLSSGIIPAMGLFVYEYSGFKLSDGGDAILLMSGANTISAISYGDVSHISGLGAVQNLSESDQGKSGALIDGSWVTDQTPTRGWFNDAGQDGRAPLLSTIDEILLADGIISNIGELDDPSSTPANEDDGALYFEKEDVEEEDGEKEYGGKIVFESNLNLTNQDTVAVLQSLGEKMEMSDGWIKFDSETAEEMSITGARIYMYGINEFGYDDENPVEVDDLVVKDDSDGIIDPEDSEYPDLGSFDYDSEENDGQIIFTTDHFTQFFMRDTMKPVVSSFDIPETADSLTVNNIHVGAHDNPRGNPSDVMFTESGTKPLASSLDWSSFGASSYTYVFTSDGTKTLYAWVKDAEGNVSDLFTSDSVTITLEEPANTPPSFDAIGDQTVNENSSEQSVSITNVSPGDESEQTVSMSATSSDQSIIPNPTITEAGSTRTLIYTPVADANGSVTITVTADDGQSANNIYSDTFTITVNPVADTIAPDVVLTDDHSDSVIRDADTIIITATFTENDAINEETSPKISVHSEPLLVDNALMTKVDNLTWTYEWDVPSENDGEHTVTILAYDMAGNPNTAATGQTSYTIDNTAPTATIEYSTTAPINGSVTATLDPSEDVIVTNNGGETSYEFTENGSFAFEFVDEAGNDGSATATVENIDTIAPIITLTGDNPQTIELGTGYAELGATTDDDSEVIIDASAFVDAVGSYTITYNAMDTAGNSADMVTRTVDVVNTIPEAPVNLQVNPSSPTNNTQPTLSWDEVVADPAVTGYTVEIYDSNEDTIYSETVTVNSFVPDDSLEDDNYTWDVRAHNDAGDSDWSEVANFTIDTAGPSVESLSNDESDYSLPLLREELFGATMTFSEKLNDAGRTVIENALTAGADRALTFRWNDNNDGDGAKLRISVSGTETAIFANDVVANVTDLAGNTANSLLLVDSVLSDTQTAPETDEDGSGDATLNDEKPEVVITDPNQEVNITIDSGTDDPTINVSAFIIDGTGMLPEINITSADANNANVAIPASTTVTSDDVAWDGIIAAPTVTTVTLPETSGETKTLSTAIEVGFTGAKLSFDKAVRILLPGQAGKRAGYVRTGTAFTEITSTCAADDQATGDALVADGDCKIDVGGDLVIWTKHFTSFATYTQTAVVSTSAPVTTSSVPSGGGSYVPYVAPVSTPTPSVLGAVTAVGDSANLAKYNLNEGDTVSATGSSDPDIYIVNAWGYKRLFLNPAIFNFYAHLGWSRVKSVVSGARDAFPTSGLFRNCEVNDTKVYAVDATGEDSGVLHWVNMTGDQAVTEDANFFKKVFCVNNNEFGWYSKSSIDYTSLSQIPVYSR